MPNLPDQGRRVRPTGRTLLLVPAAATALAAIVVTGYVPEPLLAQRHPMPRAPHADVAHGDSTHALVASYRRARALLDAAVAAHGGIEALRAARTVQFSMRGHDHWRSQSRRVEPPFDSTPHEVEVRIDLARERVTFEQRFQYPGDIHRAYRSVTDGARSFRADLRAGTIARTQWPPASQQNGNLFYLPQHILLSALENPGALRYVGRMRLSSGAEADVIATALAGGGLSLAFDAGTGRLRATLGVWGDPTTGDVAQEIEYPSYHTVGGVLLPTRRVWWTDGTRTRDLAYTAATTRATDDDAVAPPAEFSESPPAAAQPVRALADGVWLVATGGSSVLAVAMRDHVVVIDAPAGLDSVALARIGALAGKPVRYAVPTHHHDDHAAGARALAAAGVTLVTTPGNRAWLVRLATARPTAVAGAAGQGATPRAPTVETITGGRRTMGDGTRTVELLDIGAGPHAEEMIVAWLPAEGILFQGDLIDVNADGVVTRGANNATTMHFARWLRERGIRPRVFAGAHGTLASPAEWERLIAGPLRQ